MVSTATTHEVFEIEDAFSLAELEEVRERIGDSVRDGAPSPIRRHRIYLEPQPTPNSLTDYAAEWTATWRRQAACRGADGLFFNGRGGNDATSKALAICMTCPVRSECLEFAIDNAQAVGIWGGLPLRWREKARRLIRRQGLTVSEAIDVIDHERGLRAS